MWEAAFKLDPRPDFGPPSPTTVALFCATCEVGDTAMPWTPCWYCGGGMTTTKPKVWSQNGGPTVRFQPGEGAA